MAKREKNDGENDLDEILAGLSRTVPVPRGFFERPGPKRAVGADADHNAEDHDTAHAEKKYDVLDAETATRLRKARARLFAFPPDMIEEIRASHVEDDIEASITLDTLKAQSDFIDEFEMYAPTEVPKSTGMSAKDLVDSGRIVEIQAGEYLLYPKFQFDDEGKPFPLLKDVIAALPNLSGWQQAFWLSSETEVLQGRAPIQAIKDGDRNVIAEAADAYRVFEG